MVHWLPEGLRNESKKASSREKDLTLEKALEIAPAMEAMDKKFKELKVAVNISRQAVVSSRSE